MYCVALELERSVGVDDTSMIRSRSKIVGLVDVLGPACDVCRFIICLIRSSWFFETTPQSKQGKSESKYFLCVNVYCCVTGCIVAADVCAMLVCK